MTAVEDRTRAAMDAITALVEDVPPLPLPPPAGAPATSRGFRRARLSRRPWGSWLAPAAAAAAVLVIAITLVAVRDMPGGQPPPPASVNVQAGAPVSFPRYYVALDQGWNDTTVPVGLVLGATLTGKKLFTLQPPHGLSFSGVTAAADDRTFVAAAHLGPYGDLNYGGRAHWWYLVRVVGTGSRVRLTMTKLRIPATPARTEVSAIALSPDGTMLAVVTTPPFDDIRQATQLLRVYSVSTGAVLHSWSTPPEWSMLGDGFAGGGVDASTAMSWVGNHALAFGAATVRKGSPGSTYLVRELDLSSPDGNLLASVRSVASVPMDNWEARSEFGCGLISRGDILVTGDGNSFVCGGEGTSGAKLPTALCSKAPTWNTVGFAAYSLTTGQARSMVGYRTNCYGYALESPYPLWVNATGSTVIGYLYLGFGTPGNRFGVFSQGSFRPLPNPVPGNWYQYGAGSMLYLVAF